MKYPMSLRGAAVAALLACAGAAQAQSNVTLSGLVDLSAGRFQSPGAQKLYRVENGSMTTSYWALRGSEDLGGGLKAVFAMESFFRGDTGAAGRFDGDKLFARNAYVGLTSPTLGTVQMGRNTTLLFVSTISFNAFGDSYGFSPTVRHVFTSRTLGGNTITGDSGWSDSVLYATPSFGGFKAAALVAAGEANGGRNWSASANYAGGPFAATAVIQDVKKDDAGPADTRTWQVGASYDFGVAKVFVQHSRAKNNTVAGRPEAKLTDVSAAIPVTAAGKVLVGYGLLDRATEADQRTVSLAYDHYLSKRTDVYVAAMRDKNDAVATLQSATSYAVGIRHRF